MVEASRAEHLSDAHFIMKLRSLSWTKKNGKRGAWLMYPVAI